MRILYLPNVYSQQRQREKKANIYPVRLASEAEWYRKQGHYVQWGSYWYPQEEEIDLFDKIITEPENLPFLTLPRPDRVFTRAKEYTSGNYQGLLGTHYMSSSSCWWSKCTFCCENGKTNEVRSVGDVISELEEIKSLGFEFAFDDAATISIGEWLEKFCNSVLPKLNLGCNMRITKNVDFDWMKQVGFRMLLFGIESANQETLDRISKGVKVEDIIPTIRKASEAGLEPHICVIFGHPNETDEDAIRTLKLVHYLLRKGWAKTAQASFYQVAGETGKESHRKYIKQIYNAAYHLDFWFNQLREIHNIDDLKYLWLKIKKGVIR